MPTSVGITGRHRVETDCRHHRNSHTEAAAVREVDLQRRFRFSATELAKLLKVNMHDALVLRRHLNVDEDKDCVHVFVFGGSKHPRYSDTALKRIRAALEAEPDLLPRLKGKKVAAATPAKAA